MMNRVRAILSAAAWISIMMIRQILCARLVIIHACNARVFIVMSALCVKLRNGIGIMELTLLVILGLVLALMDFMISDINCVVAVILLAKNAILRHRQNALGVRIR